MAPNIFVRLYRWLTGNTTFYYYMETLDIPGADHVIVEMKPKDFERYIEEQDYAIIPILDGVETTFLATPAGPIEIRKKEYTS